MLKNIIFLLAGIGLIYGQSSLDILSTPTDTRDAALGITLNPTVKPTRILTHPERTVTLSVWNWAADIQGAYMGISRPNTHLSLQAMNSGDLELRDGIPTVEPLSTFQYNLFNTGGAYARNMGPLVVGLGAEFIYERTLNASAAGLSLNLATAYELNERLLLSAGVRHAGSTGDLDQENTELPTEVWAQLDAAYDNLNIYGELNNGSIPSALGISYALLNKFELIAGLQVISAEPDVEFHPSIGFTADWDSFTIGYAIYQVDHNLGPRHFVSLYWNY